MNIDSQISAVKVIEYNTINSMNSFNYVYKKATIKEKYNNMVNEIRSLNFENIANNKMQHMNFNYMINSIINLKKIINNKNPYMRYIKYVKPYNIQNSKINIKNKNYNNKVLFDTKNKLNINKNILKKEKLIDFNKNKKNYRNFYFTRMCNTDLKKINTNITDKIILLQKNIRGFLSKKTIDEIINNAIAKNIIKSILMIQRKFRKFLHKKKSLDNLIINIIKNERITQSNKITDIFSLYHYRNFYKKHLLIKKIVVARYNSASLIQSKFKSFIVRRKVKDIMKKEKKSYILTYPFKAEKVQIKIFKDKSFKKYNYFICPIRKYFITYIDKKQIEAGEYLCHIIVDNNVKIDNRYKYINKNNVIYNLISFGNILKKKKKPKQIEIEIEKKNKEIKKQKDKEKKLNDELENFYFYYYNNNNEDNENNSNSYNSDSTNSEHEKNKLDYRNQIDDNDPDQVIDISNQFYKSKINNFFLKSNYKYIKENKKDDLMNITFGNINNNNNNNKIIKEYKLKEYLKEDAGDDDDDDIGMKNIFQRFDIYDTKDDDENSIHQSASMNYHNILDELSQSANSVVSNISMRNINYYSKKTHNTKYKEESKLDKEDKGKRLLNNNRKKSKNKKK